MPTNDNQISVYIYNSIKNAPEMASFTDRIVTIVSKSYSELSTMSNIIRKALDYRKDIPEDIQKVFFQTENFLYDDDLEPEGAYVLTQEYLARIMRSE